MRATQPTFVAGWKLGLRVILEVIPAEYFGTNCWVLAPDKNSECIVVDPGMAIGTLVPQLREVFDRNNLKPIAQLVTHGHLDHTFSVAPLDQAYDVPALIHPLDRPYLGDPAGLLTPGGMIDSILAQLGVGKDTFVEPSTVREVVDGEEFSIAGFSIKAIHAPGHTPGSTMFLVNNEILISGDVLFAGSIGRTDLLKGSDTQMRRTLKEKILTLADEIEVLPGHGKETTIGFERKNNDFLSDAYLKGA
jgi:glyoxylase-like metal-dependent hydrolase (beta-lactamase superfamily II)